MAANSKISVIIPCHNVKHCVEEAIHSVSLQSRQPLEIICVENCSSDGTLDFLKSIKSKYNLIIIEENRKGAPFARNHGLEHSKGEHIQFLDADDLLLLDKLKTQSELMDIERADFIVGSFEKIESDGTSRKFIPSDQIWKALFSAKLGITSANLWRKKALEKIGGWNESLGSSQEYDLMFRLLVNKSKAVIDKNISSKVRSGVITQISAGNQSENWSRYIQLRKKMLDHLKENEPILFKEGEQFFLQQLFDSIRTLANYNLPLATEFHVELIPGNFEPMISSATSRTYLILYGIFGFSITEKIKKIFS